MISLIFQRFSFVLLAIRSVQYLGRSRPFHELGFFLDVAFQRDSCLQVVQEELLLQLPFSYLIDRDLVFEEPLVQNRIVIRLKNCRSFFLKLPYLRHKGQYLVVRKVLFDIVTDCYHPSSNNVEWRKIATSFAKPSKSIISRSALSYE